MHGRQSEIQRIQSKLQRIGQSNPHRVSALEPKTCHNEQEHQPTDTNTETNGVELDSVEEMSQKPDRDVPVSAHEHDNSLPSPPPWQDRENVTEHPPPLPDAVTFLPQHPWPHQIYPVPHDVRENIHQLADTLRQPSLPHYPASSRSPHQHRPYHSYEPWQDGHNEDHHSHHDKADSVGHQVLSPFQSNLRFTMSQGIVWLAGAIVVRVGIDRLLIHFPNLWVVMAAIVLTPVAIALYQTAVNPQSTVHSGRRLLVIMMGLLIGGQL